MNNFFTKTLILLLLGINCFGQIYFSATKKTSLSSAAEVVTVQQAATGTKVIQFISYYFDCSVACTVTVERNGTSATTTTLTVSKLNPDISTSSTASAFSSSNVGSGTVLANFNCTAACAYSFDATLIKLVAARSSDNFTIRSSSITGTVTINIVWGEL